MSKYYLGIDLGSTTSKAVVVDDQGDIIGKGITNTRANYTVAAEIARMEAVYNARFSLLKSKLEPEMQKHPKLREFINSLEHAFRYVQFRERADKLVAQMQKVALAWLPEELKEKAVVDLKSVHDVIMEKIRIAFLSGKIGSGQQFFRDIYLEEYQKFLETEYTVEFDKYMILYDKSITEVENEMIAQNFGKITLEAMQELEGEMAGVGDQVFEGESILFDAEFQLLMGEHKHVFQTVREQIQHIASIDIVIENMVGTGYGRALLPFPQDCIRSEILCHAYGAHIAFPNTRSVLDIGGQDTKAIQVNDEGLVTSFQMNDRCAAGCGRYLGYIADELNISLNELGPMALKSEKEVTICSTCTVFAGAELRELINVGEKREDILSGLHKAIVMRAMSLLARSGGVRNELTFTGGVARNQAILKFVSEMVHSSYGEDIQINVDSDSIFMGALGAARFALQNLDPDLPQKKGAKSKVSSN